MNISLRNVGIVAGLALFALAAPAAESAAAEKSAKPARATWDTFWFGERILKIGLERLGYTVAEPKTLNNPARYPAVAQGDVDYETDAVIPNASAFIEKVKADVELVGPLMNPGSIQGYLIDRKTAEAHGITSLEDLKKDDVRKLFDGDGDGKADLIGCNPGWNCEKFINHHIGAYGLADHVKHVQGEYNVLVGDTVGRLKRGDSVLLYAWYPNTATIQMTPGEDLVWITVPYTDLPDGGKADTTQEGLKSCAAGAGASCNLGWAATQYYVAANRKWLTANPQARKLFELVKVGLEDRVTQNLAMKNGEDSEADLTRHAEQWIASNKAAFDGWVEEARKAGSY